MDPAAYPSSQQHHWTLEDLFSSEKERPARAAGTNDSGTRLVLLKLSFLEQKIHQLRDLVNLMTGEDKQAMELSEKIATPQQQLVAADLTSIIVQLISAAGSLLPSIKNSVLINPVLGQPQSTSEVGFAPPNNRQNSQCYADQMSERKYAGKPCISITKLEEHILKNEEDAGARGYIPPGSYKVLQLEKEKILAPHAHFCQICGKGFKRDANLRMHMRGHGDEYKTVAALSKPSKETGLDSVLTKRYSCPYLGCKHNKDNINFQPLKTMLCVKNHYKRIHCDKNYTCSRCNRKMFSVLADLKTHEKHCGSGKWLCSCGTTVSRKDKLFGHVALFQGHTPAVPVKESQRSNGTFNGNENDQDTKINGMELSFCTQFTTGSDSVKESLDGSVPITCFLDFDSFNFAGFDDFPP